MEHQLFDSVHPRGQLLTEQVADKISQLIIDSHILQGEKLPNEFELAQQLQVGRGTIREAVKLLVAKNVLEIRRGKGTYVTKQTGVVDDPFGFAYITDNIKLASDLLDLRLLIEPWAARIAAERATDTDIDILKAACEAVNEKLRKKENQLAEDENFHVALANCTQNLVVPKIIPVIIYSVHQLDPMNKASSDYDKIMRESTMITHQKIMDAIIRHDPDAAEKAMREHLENNRTAIQRSIEER